MSHDLAYFKKLYIQTARENFDTLTKFFPPNSQEELDEVYRGAHSLKGKSYAIGYGHMGSFSATLEAIFAAVKNGTLVLDEVKNAAITMSFEVIKQALDVIEEEGRDPDLSIQQNSLAAATNVHVALK